VVRLVDSKGAPVRIRDEIYGNLYLTEKRNGTRSALEVAAHDEGAHVTDASAATTAGRRRRTG
jgi:hypothetical protein